MSLPIKIETFDKIFNSTKNKTMYLCLGLVVYENGLETLKTGRADNKDEGHSVNTVLITAPVLLHCVLQAMPWCIALQKCFK